MAQNARFRSRRGEIVTYFEDERGVTVIARGHRVNLTELYPIETLKAAISHNFTSFGEVEETHKIIYQRTWARISYDFVRRENFWSLGRPGREHGATLMTVVRFEKK